MREPLSERVLVLNRLWQAVHIVGGKRALSLLFTGHARVLHPTDDNWQVWPAEEWVRLSHAHPAGPHDLFVHSIRHTVRLPRILLLNEYSHQPLKEVRLNRQSIFERDSYRCQYCGKVFPPHQLNLDHVIPKERGGQMTWDNITTSCISCNSHKSNRTPQEAHMRLLRRPKQPKSRPFISYILGEDIPEVWQDFILAQDQAPTIELVGSTVSALQAAPIVATQSEA